MGRAARGARRVGEVLASGGRYDSILPSGRASPRSRSAVGAARRARRMPRSVRGSRRSRPTIGERWRPTRIRNRATSTNGCIRSRGCIGAGPGRGSPALSARRRAVHLHATRRRGAVRAVLREYEADLADLVAVVSGLHDRALAARWIVGAEAARRADRGSHRTAGRCGRELLAVGAAGLGPRTCRGHRRSVAARGRLSLVSGAPGRRDAWRTTPGTCRVRCTWTWIRT